jgi:hypothetical protein
VDDRDRQQEADGRPDREAERGVAEREQARTDEDREARVAARVGREELQADVPHVGQVDVIEGRDPERGHVVDRDPGSEDRVEPPWVAGEPLGQLPGDQEERHDRDEADDRAHPPRAGTPASRQCGGRDRAGHSGAFLAARGGQLVTAWSAISSARSITSKPSASCSSVMHSGGFVWIELLATIV